MYLFINDVCSTKVMAKTPKKLIVELNVIMDAMGINYPKYWL
jgi:hypothetical protein